MDLMKLFMEVDIKDNASTKIEQLKATVGEGLKTAAKVGTAAVAAAGTAIAKITKDAVSAFGDYEQLVGGIDTLFGDASNKVVENAKNAFKTAGLSANEYMDTAISFSGALLKSLGNDTQRAAELTQTTISDMADQANKYGKTVEEVSETYTSLARGNFQTLDNLFGGMFKGTKEGLSEMLRYAEQYRASQGETVRYSEDSYADIVSAIHDVSVATGVYGTTALEAGTTIQGSLASMKSAWQNVLTALTGGTEDFAYSIHRAIKDLITTIVGDGTETNRGLLKNIEPVVMAVLENIPTLLNGIFPTLVAQAQSLVDNLLEPMIVSVTNLISSASGLIPTIITVITKNLPILLNAGVEILGALAEGILDNLDGILDAALNVIMTLLTGLTNNVDKLVEGAKTVIYALIGFFMDHTQEVVEAGVELITALVLGLVEAIPQIVNALPQITSAIYAGLIEKAPEILHAGAELISNLVQGMISWLSGVAGAAQNIIDAIRNVIGSIGSEAWSWGKDLVQNFIAGIDAWFGELVGRLRNIGQTIRDFIGFSEPKKGPLSNFHTYAPDMMKLFAKGIEDNEDIVTAQISKSFAFDTTAGRTSMTHEYGNDSPMTIIVQSVLDGTVIGETAYQYSKQKTRMMGLA